jgi:hypothetical protein
MTRTTVPSSIRQRDKPRECACKGAFSVRYSRGIHTVGTAANAAIVPTVGLGAAAPFGPLLTLGVALTGIGILLLRGGPIRHL